MEDMTKISHLMQKIYKKIAENTKCKLTKNQINFKTTIGTLYYIMFTPLLITGLAQNIRDGDYVVDAMYDVITVICSFLYGFILFIVKKKNIYKLIDILSKELFIYCTPFSNEQLKINLKAGKDAKLFLILVVLSAVGGVGTKVLPSLFYLLLRLSDGIKEGDKVHFPIHCYVPTFVDTVPKYMFAYCFTLIFYLIMTSLYIVATTLYTVSIIYARKEIKILIAAINDIDERSEFLKSNCVTKRAGTNTTLPLENYVHIFMRDVIEHHIAIISLVELLNDIFGFIFFALAQGVCLMLSVSAHRLSDVKISINGDLVNYAGTGLAALFTFWVYAWLGQSLINEVKISINGDLVNYAGTGLAALFTFWVYAWLGQSLINEDAKLRQALYSCSWLNKSTKFRKTLMIMMERTKRPLCIRIGKIYILNFTTFSNIMNAAYSYFNLLRTVRHKKTE